MYGYVAMLGNVSPQLLLVAGATGGGVLILGAYQYNTMPATINDNDIISACVGFMPRNE